VLGLGLGLGSELGVRVGFRVRVRVISSHPFYDSVLFCNRGEKKHTSAG
jgi:hypothetical protein